MKKYLLDTNAATAAIYDLKGIREQVNQQRRNGAKIGIAMPVAAEIL